MGSIVSSVNINSSSFGQIFFAMWLLSGMDAPFYSIIFVFDAYKISYADT